MRKTIRKLLCAVVLSLLVVFASACTFFESEDERRISNVYTVRSDDDTGIYIVIEYSGDYPSDRFFIEDPEQGKDGNGIEKIESELLEGTTKITIYYTDISRMPTELLLPHGRYIESITTATDEETNVVTMTIAFSDGSEPMVLTLQPGRDGKDGDTISRFETVEDGEGNLILFVYAMRHNAETGEHEEVEVGSFTIPKGERGNGILSISVNYMTYDDPNNMYLDIFYEDGGYETIALPRANSWYTGSGAPNYAWYNVGDFYFDTTGYAIYQKQVDGWTKLVDFSEFNSASHAVYFYLDSETLSDIIYITHGHNFASSPETLSEPQREGFRFLGWYTEYIEADGEPSPNAGHFTVLTPVLSNTVLYARWETVK